MRLPRQFSSKLRFPRKSQRQTCTEQRLVLPSRERQVQEGRTTLGGRRLTWNPKAATTRGMLGLETLETATHCADCVVVMWTQGQGIYSGPCLYFVIHDGLL